MPTRLKIPNGDDCVRVKKKVLPSVADDLNRVTRDDRGELRCTRNALSPFNHGVLTATGIICGYIKSSERKIDKSRDGPAEFFWHDISALQNHLL